MFMSKIKIDRLLLIVGILLAVATTVYGEEEKKKIGRYAAGQGGCFRCY